MLKIRLQRVGRKNVPTFRVVLTDSKNSTKSGKYLEILGVYNPVNKIKEIDIERAKYWISKGAKLSDTLHNFFIDKKAISGKKINVLPVKNKTLKRKELKSQAGEKKNPAPVLAATPGAVANNAEVKMDKMPPAETKAAASAVPVQI